MSPPLVGCLGFLLLFILMAMGLPIAFSMITVGFLGLIYLSGLHVALDAVVRIPFYWTTIYIFICCPLYILMGLTFARSGMAKDLFQVAYKWMGRLPGGLALATVGACGMFAAVSGTSTAGASVMAPLAYPEMKRYGYDKGLSTGVIAAGGTLGGMIPPSVGFVLYSLLTDASVGALFMAGIIPGILEVVTYWIVITILVKWKPQLAPPTPVKFSFKEKILSLKNVWPALVLFLVVLGGIYSGVFTPVESSAVGAVFSVGICLVMKRLTFAEVVKCVWESARVTALIFMMLMAAMVFNAFLALSNMPNMLAGALGSLGSPALVLGIILFLYLPLGCVLDTTGMWILTIPLYLPILQANGINLVWFGVLAMRCAELGLITPPVGMNVFIVHGIVKDLSLERAFRGVVPFIFADMFNVILLALFPILSLLIPTLMRGR